MLMRNTSGDSRLCLPPQEALRSPHPLLPQTPRPRRRRPPAGEGDDGVLRLVPSPVSGQFCAWDELASYVYFFTSHPPSLQASIFLRCLHIFRALAMIAAGRSQAEYVDKLYPVLGAAEAKANPRAAALHAFFHKVRQNPPRNFSTWTQIWLAAAKRLKNLALKCPELKGKLHCHITLPGVGKLTCLVAEPAINPRWGRMNRSSTMEQASHVSWACSLFAMQWALLFRT